MNLSPDASTMILASQAEHEFSFPQRADIKARMRLVSRAAAFKITAETRLFMGDAGFSLAVAEMSSAGVLSEYQSEINTRLIAEAVSVYDGRNWTKLPLATWRDCSDEQLTALFRIYEDHSMAVDPIGAISDSRFAEIESAAKKKQTELLMSFGRTELVSFVLTLVGQPSTSPTQS